PDVLRAAGDGPGRDGHLVRAGGPDAVVLRGHRHHAAAPVRAAEPAGRAGRRRAVAPRAEPAAPRAGAVGPGPLRARGRPRAPVTAVGVTTPSAVPSGASALLRHAEH